MSFQKSVRRREHSARRKERRAAGIGCVLFSLLLLCGCGAQGNLSESGAASDSPEQSGFAEDIAVFSGTGSFQETAYAEAETMEPGFAYQSKDVLADSVGNVRYQLVSYDCDGESRIFLECWKERTSAERCEELFLPQEWKGGRILCMNAVSKTSLALLCEKNGSLGILYPDSENQISRTTEVTDGYAEKEITADTLYQGGWWCDSSGYSYVVQSGNTLLVFDPEGKYVMRENFGEESEVTTAFHETDGSLIFAVSEQPKTNLYICDVTAKKTKQIAGLDGIGMRQFAVQEDGRILYSDTDGIRLWDVATGKRELLLDLKGTDIRNNSQESVEQVLLSEKGELLVYVRTGSGTVLHVFSDAPVTDEGIVVMDLSSDGWLKRCTASYSRAQENITVSYTSASYGDDEAWTRLSAELAAGKGPDIICLFDREKLEILYGKGVLYDLQELLSEEMIGQLFAGSREFGTVDGTLAGLCLSGKPFVMLTSDQIRAEDHWTYRDVCEIVAQNPDLEGLFSYGGSLSPEYNLTYLLTMNPDNTEFLDRKKGSCYFDTEEFAAALTLCRKYGEMQGSSSEEAAQKIHDGRLLADVEYLFYPGQYAELLERYGEGSHFIGFPGQEDYVGYWSSGRLLVVNRNTVYKEEIADFLGFLTEPENLRQIQDGVATMESAVRYCVEWEEWSGEWVYRSSGNGSYPFSAPDGESYLESYLTFLDQLGPWSGSTQISGIISEEAGDYFSGSKTAEQAAGLIQNRVQLYLDER